MENLSITSPSNPTIKKARGLHQRKIRQETGLFLVEGIHHVGAAIEAGWKIESILYAPELLKSGYGWKLVREQTVLGSRCMSVAMDVFSSIADKDNPQGILAIVRQQHPALESLNEAGFQTGVAVVSPQDPGNVGAILRTLDATGADGFFLLNGGVDPYHPSAVRASMGALFWKPFLQLSFEDFISWARKAGCRIVGTSAHAEQNYDILHGQRDKTVLLLGSEQKGLSPEQTAACDLVVSIPMRGRVSSLNLAVATGVLLYQMMAE